MQLATAGADSSKDRKYCRAMKMEHGSGDRISGGDTLKEVWLETFGHICAISLAYIMQGTYGSSDFCAQQPGAERS